MEHVSWVRPTGKFPEKVENLKRWSGTRPRTGVYDQMEQLFTAFLPIGNSTFATTEISVFFS